MSASDSGSNIDQDDESVDSGCSHPNTEDEKAFFEAARTGDLDKFYDLLNSEKVRCDCRDEDTDETAFHIAACNGQRAILKAFASIPGFDPHITDERSGDAGETAAFMCAAQGKLDNLKMLVEIFGQSVLFDKGNLGDNLLFNVVFSCSDEAAVVPLVKYILEQAPNMINEPDRDGTTPLSAAAINSQSAAVINLLLDAGADVTLTDKDGSTCLHNCYDECKVLEAFLLSGKCSQIIDYKNNDGKTVLDLAQEEYDRIKDDEDYTAKEKLESKKLLEMIKAVSV
jgi:ankyrin repeat protein